MNNLTRSSSTTTTMDHCGSVDSFATNNYGIGYNLTFDSEFKIAEMPSPDATGDFETDYTLDKDILYGE